MLGISFKCSIMFSILLEEFDVDAELSKSVESLDES